MSTVRIGLYHESAGAQESGGIATFVREMALSLADEEDVVLYTREGPVLPRLRRSRVEVVELPLPPRAPALQSALARATPLSDQNALKLLAFLGARRSGHLDDVDRRVDVLLTQQWMDDLLLSNALETPTVFEFHAGNGPVEPGPASRLRGWLSRSRYTLANSRQAAAAARRELGLAVDGVVYPGVAAGRYTPAVEQAFERDRPVVLFVGRLRAGKGLYDLVDAFVPLADDAELRVVGRGDEASVRERARDRGIADAVVVDGVVPEEELPGYYAASDVFCLPSHYEGLGIVNLEAMATGTPVVTTDAGGIPEYASHEENALVVPPGDTGEITAALERLLASPDLRRALGDAGRETAGRFSWDRQARQLASFCEAVLEREGRARTSREAVGVGD